MVLVARPMRSADPGGRAGGCIGRAPAESGTHMYCGSVVVAPAVSADAIFFIKKSFFSKKSSVYTSALTPASSWTLVSAASLSSSKKLVGLFSLAGNGGTGAARTPLLPPPSPSGRTGRPVGQAGREHLPRASLPAPAPPVPPRWSWSPLAWSVVLADGKCWRLVVERRQRGSPSGLPRG